MGRKSREYLNQLKEKLNTDRLWSFSSINRYLTCPYSYFLNYVLNIPQKESGIYGVLGGSFHEILEKLYNNEIEYKDMIDEVENIILGVELEEMKFNKGDEESNEKIQEKYYSCIRHFFNNHRVLDYKVLTEKFITIKVGNEYYQGYIDAIYKDEDGYVNIVDFKTSTIYTGKKIEKEGRQLLLYAIGLTQQGIPMDKIKIKWNFLKYLSVTYKQKNGKMKTLHAERWAWVGKIKSPLKMFLKDNGYDEEKIDELLNQCIENNSIDILPKEIQDLFVIDDCYVEIPFNQDTINKLNNDLIEVMKEIREKEKLYKETKDESLWIKKVEDKDSFFCSNLCGYTIHDCKCYKEYLEDKDMFKKDEYKNEELKDDDDSWLKELGL